MPGTVHLVHGDIFDGPADVVVLPCSTAGTVTSQVARRLAQFSIPKPTRMPLGTVQILALKDVPHLAQAAAFAASVAGYTSEPGAIEQIGRALGQATQDSQGISIINAPLLGAGAGGLQSELVVEQLRRGFLAEAANAGVLNIHVLHENVYQRVLSNLTSLPGHDGADAPPVSEEAPSDRAERPSEPSAREDAPIRVLISYTSSSQEPEPWVEDLYIFLRREGVDARIDSHSIQYGMDTVQWMCNELQLADRVLLICDERYAQRADGRHGGVGWEVMIIQGDLFSSMYGGDQQQKSAKYIPIIRTADIVDGRPKFLATKRVLHWPPDADVAKCQEKLLRDLYFDQISEPPLGRRRSTL